MSKMLDDRTCRCGHIMEAHHEQVVPMDIIGCTILGCECVMFENDWTSHMTTLILGTTMWVIDPEFAGDPPRLVPPIIVNHKTGEGAPGVYDGNVRVLREGTTVRLLERA